jgi:UDP-N-acetylglucosamine--N-acetylmuramyl-(pentapeptide) pyrophosphoryl-undecaprenol N-acetylglucosamine transferase
MTDVLIICGGTGGHLSPGIALAEELKSRGFSSILCISQKSIDTAIVSKYAHIDFERFPGKGFAGGLLGKLKFFQQLIFSLPRIFGIIRKEKPKILVLFGGYLSVGFGLMSILLNVKFALHEANGRTGKAVRLLQVFADRIYLPKSVVVKDIKKSKVANVGYPLRKEMMVLDKIKARRQLGLDCEGTLLMVIGGSQGAQVLNKWVIDHFEHLIEQGVSIYCISGLNNGLESYDVSINSRGESVTIKMVPFTDNMAAVLSAADLVVSRAGAGAIAEITHCEVPSILVPYPYAADNHQYYNAKVHESLGGGVLLEEENIEKLCEEVHALISNHSLLEQINLNLINLNAVNASEVMVDDLLSVIGEKTNES